MGILAGIEAIGADMEIGATNRDPGFLAGGSSGSYREGAVRSFL